MESQRRDLTKEIRELEALERSHDWDDLTPMINKCFKRKILGPNHQLLGYEYACIIGLPPVTTERSGEARMNKYQLPAIYFRYSPMNYLPFDTSPEDNYGDVFYYDNIFTGDLPEEYRNGAIFSGRHEMFEECSHTDFISAADNRYRQFIQKIFEPTTPRL